MNNIALRFNPIDENEITFDRVTTNWVKVDDFFIQTNKGPILEGILWKDTPNNIKVIEQIINEKKELKSFKNKTMARIYGLVHTREK